MFAWPECWIVEDVQPSICFPVHRIPMADDGKAELAMNEIFGTSLNVDIPP